MRLTTLVIGVPVAAAAIAFSIANRAPMTIDLWPLPQPLDIPVYVLALVPFVIGVLVGGFVTFVNGGRKRAKVREQGREIARLEREMSMLKSQLAEAEKAAKAGGDDGDDKKMIAA